MLTGRDTLLGGREGCWLYLYGLQALLPSLREAGEGVQEQYHALYQALYADPEELLSLPTAVNVGNHDAGSSAYSQHFQVPNVSSLGMTEKTGKFGGDYWYTYNNVLFMSLNSNNMSTAEHREFMKTVLEEMVPMRTGRW